MMDKVGAAAGLSDGGPGKVLVADDSPLARRWVAACLTLEGYRVTTASDGEEALDKARSEAPDALILDAVMPGLGARGLVRRLRESPVTEAIPVALMAPPGWSARDFNDDQTGYDSFLRKPVSRSELLAVTRSLVKRAKSARKSVPDATILRGLAQVLEALDPETREHSERVGDYAFRLGRRLGLPEQDIQALRRGAFLHDIGKVKLGGAALSRPGPLTNEEVDWMRTHPAQGARILESFGGGGTSEEAIRHHHERWDGSGYPNKLKGNAIPLAARILAVADTYDVLTTGRPYQTAISPSEAAAVLRGEGGKRFDPRVVDSFLEMLGLEVEIAPGAGAPGIGEGGARGSEGLGGQR